MRGPLYTRTCYPILLPLLLLVSSTSCYRKLNSSATHESKYTVSILRGNYGAGSRKTDSSLNVPDIPYFMNNIFNMYFYFICFLSFSE